MTRSNRDGECAGWSDFLARLYERGEFDIELGLGPMKRALELEDSPHRSHASILVGGTNGKGETAAFLSSILQAHGLRVGLYTSPHIVDLRERFRVDGVPLGREEVLAIGRPVLESYTRDEDSHPSLSFFELTTLIASLAFEDQQVDVAVYEVGLGGRLDATNALDPDVSVVTSIALDHTEYLGETLEDIAREKAGIFRSNRPAVIGRQADALRRRLLEKLGPTDCALYGRDYEVTDETCIELGETSLPLELSWDAPTRSWNAACAAMAAYRFLEGEFDEESAREGLSRTRWPGRLDVRRLPDPNSEDGTRAHTYLFDAAHNDQAARQLFDFIDRNHLELGAVVCSAMRDKDLEGIFAPLPDEVPVFATRLDSPRGARAEQLSRTLEISPETVGTTARSLRRARRIVDSLDDGQAVILVYGSIYLLGEAFEELGIASDELRTYME
ncbi:MAG: bifunctional folylpolyglutamate synthase/dihydrofolate synthase [Persicimonas sp.]